MDDLKKKFSPSDLQKKAAVLYKAEKTNFVAIDGVLIFVSSRQLVVAGLQMTVAEKQHSLNQEGVVSFSEYADWVLGGRRV